MSETSPERPIARLTSELKVSGLGQFALGLACLVVGLTGTDLAPVRVVVPFVATFAAMGVVSVSTSRWLRAAAMPSAPSDVRIEPASTTTRRSLIKVAVALFLVGIATSLGPVLGAVFGGMLCAAGAVELRDYSWLRDRERGSGREIHREVGRFPRAGGPRALYTRPMNASTLAT